MQTTRPTPENEKTRQQARSAIRIISLAMAGSIAMFGFVLKMQDKLGLDFEVTKSNLATNQLVQILTALGMLVYAMSFVIPPIVANANKAQTPRQRFTTRTIIRLALLEATALMGFFAATMTGDAIPYTIFATLGIATILASLNDEPSV